LPHVVLRAQLFVKVGARTVVPDPLSGALPLGDNVGSGYLRDGSLSVWSSGKESHGALRTQLFVKIGARAPCPMESAPL